MLSVLLKNQIITQIMWYKTNVPLILSRVYYILNIIKIFHFLQSHLKQKENYVYLWYFAPILSFA